MTLPRGSEATLHRWGTATMAVAAAAGISGWSVTTRRLRHRERQLSAAQTDHVTGLPVRAVWEHQVRRAVAEPAECFVAFLDLDGFKPVNDTLGHNAGDQVLRIVARRLREALPATSLITRLGGDEFGVATPGHSPEWDQVGALLAEPITINRSTPAVRVSAAIGVVRDHGQSSRLTDILHHADAAMYHAKRHGLGVCSTST